jgi:hypothetical protein
VLIVPPNIAIFELLPGDLPGMGVLAPPPPTVIGTELDAKV